MEPSSMSSWVLPMDLLLEISACSDPVTLVRCAATCKLLRRAIADEPAFRKRLRLRHADQFVPGFLRGFFVQNQHRDDVEPPRFADPRRPTEPSPEPFRSFLSDNDTLFEFYQPDLAASRGLVALRSSDDAPESGGGPPGVCVFNPMTAYLDCVPPPKINAQSFVLLTSDDGDGDGDGTYHYRLVAAELASGCLRTQDFSPADDSHQWQAVAETAVAPCPARDAKLFHPPVVLQGDAHWLCESNEEHFILRLCRAQQQPQASVTKIDGSCGEQLRGRRPGEFLLVSDGQGRRPPQLLVAAGLQISLWTLCGDGWAMQVLVEPESIHQDDVWSERLELRWFGEKSGYVFVRMAAADEEDRSWYFMLELATRRVKGVCKGSPQNALVYFPYEMDISFWHPKFTRQLLQ